MRKMKKGFKVAKFLTAALAMTFILGQAPATFSQTVTLEKYKEINPDNLFEQGMVSRKAGKIYSSIDAFEAILEKHPELHRARLELAVSYYKTFNFEGALNEAQKVLDDPQTPPNVRVAILAFMAQVKSDKEKFVMDSDWTFPIMVGYMYDSNANAGPDTRNFGSITLNPESEEVSDSAYLFNVGIDNILKTGKAFRVGENTANLVWKSMANIYHRQYFDETDYNMSVITFKTGPALVTTGQWRTGLDVQLDIIAYGNEKLAKFTSATPVFTWIFKNGIELSAECLLSHHSYEQDVDSGRSSNYIAPKIQSAYTTPDNKFLFLGHVSYFDDDANASHKTNDGYDVYAASSWMVKKNTHLYASVRYRDYDYDGIEPFFGEARDDDEWRYSAGVTHTFKDAGRMTDWYITAYYTHTDYDSNVGIYEFDRDQYNFTLNRRF